MRKRSWPAVSHYSAEVRQYPVTCCIVSPRDIDTHNLKLHSLAVELDGPDLEVDADGGDVALGVGIIGETEKKA